MGTRANIVILYGESKVYIYRHYDGYPSGLGADLASKLIEAKASPSKLLQSLLDERYEKADYETEAKRVYELTSAIHGDIEYVYYVRFSDHAGRPPEVGYAAVPDERKPSIAFGSVAEFVESINREIRATNKRYAHLRATQKHYADLQDQPEVAL